MLADQGADVIKIEQSGIGDPMRYLGTQKGGISALFANCNRGKRSIDLNLKASDDLEIAKMKETFKKKTSNIPRKYSQIPKKNLPKTHKNLL